MSLRKGRAVSVSDVVGGDVVIFSMFSRRPFTAWIVLSVCVPA